MSSGVRRSQTQSFWTIFFITPFWKHEHTKQLSIQWKLLVSNYSKHWYLLSWCNRCHVFLRKIYSKILNEKKGPLYLPIKLGNYCPFCSIDISLVPHFIPTLYNIWANFTTYELSCLYEKVIENNQFISILFIRNLGKIFLYTQNFYCWLHHRLLIKFLHPHVNINIKRSKHPTINSNPLIQTSQHNENYFSIKNA